MSSWVWIMRNKCVKKTKTTQANKHRTMKKQLPPKNRRPAANELMLKEGARNWNTTTRWLLLLYHEHKSLLDVHIVHVEMLVVLTVVVPHR